MEKSIVITVEFGRKVRNKLEREWESFLEKSKKALTEG